MSVFKVEFQEYQSLDQISQDDRDLCKAAERAGRDAYAPYSQFNVGAAVKLGNGEIYTGNNQENSAFPSGLCAERVAVFGASSHFPGVKIEAIAITARSEKRELTEPVSPCGACRQVMVEYEINQKTPIRVLMMHTDGRVRVAERAQDMLPFAFIGSNLL